MNDDFPYLTPRFDLLDRNVKFRFNTDRCRNAGFNEMPNADDYELIFIKRHYHYNEHDTDHHMIITAPKPFPVLLHKGTDINNAFLSLNSELIETNNDPENPEVNSEDKDELIITEVTKKVNRSLVDNQTVCRGGQSKSEKNSLNNSISGEGKVTWNRTLQSDGTNNEDVNSLIKKTNKLVTFDVFDIDDLIIGDTCHTDKPLQDNIETVENVVPEHCFANEQLSNDLIIEEHSYCTKHEPQIRYGLDYYSSEEVIDTEEVIATEEIFESVDGNFIEINEPGNNDGSSSSEIPIIQSTVQGNNTMNEKEIETDTRQENGILKKLETTAKASSTNVDEIPDCIITQQLHNLCLGQKIFSGLPQENVLGDEKDSEINVYSCENNIKIVNPNEQYNLSIEEKGSSTMNEKEIKTNTKQENGILKKLENITKASPTNVDDNENEIPDYIITQQQHNLCLEGIASDLAEENVLHDVNLSDEKDAEINVYGCENNAIRNPNKQYSLSIEESAIIKAEPGLDLHQEHTSINSTVSNEKVIEKTTVNLSRVKDDPDLLMEEINSDFNYEITTSLDVNLSDQDSSIEEPPLKRLKIDNFDFKGFTKVEQQNKDCMNMLEFYHKKICCLREEIENNTNVKKNIKKIPLFACLSCNYKTQQRSNLKIHLRLHFKPFWCDLCMAMYETSHELYNHIENIHCDAATVWRSSFTSPAIGEKPFKSIDKNVYKCGFCGYSASQETTLMGHMKKHEKEKLYYCDKCKFITLTEDLMDKHMETHETTLYDCKECGYITLYKKDLEKHMEIHSNEPKYRCLQCTFITSHVSYFDTHLKSHMEKTERKVKVGNVKKERRTHQCDKCNFTTKQLPRLYRHDKRVHEDNEADTKNYSVYNVGSKFQLCIECGYWAETEESFREHKNNKFNRCNFCNFISKSECDLKIHNNTEHLEQPLFRCAMCNVKFLTLKELEYHAKDLCSCKPSDTENKS